MASAWVDVKVEDAYIVSPFKNSVIFCLCCEIFCLKLATSSALKTLQPILRQEAPFLPPRACWYDLMRSSNFFSISIQVVVSAAISRATRRDGGETVIAISTVFRARSKMTQLRDQALVVVWGAHTVAESLVDRINDFNSSNEFADCGRDRHYKKRAHALNLTLELNINGRMCLRRCTLLLNVFPQFLSGIYLITLKVYTAFGLRLRLVVPNANKTTGCWARENDVLLPTSSWRSGLTSLP